ncbi:MAG: clostripain-related cysteine peptidase [Planctomycetia bacterium]|nr:clostripain-related cysteine peptidase [Planctomycetia bacterium]
MRRLLAWFGDSKRPGRSAGGRSLGRDASEGWRLARLEQLEDRRMLSWTVMVYMDGDDAGPARLATQIPGNFQELAAVGSTDDVHFVAQIDSIGCPTVFGGQKGARRGLIQQGNTPSTSWGTRLGNVDSGDPDSLIGFVQWAIQDYPADNYALILWDHGAGHAGVCWDDTSGTHLSMMGLTEALNVIPYMDVLAFDACLMGMVEVASQVAGEADVMVASEELVPGAGYDYSFVSQLVVDPSMSAASLANNMVQYYGDYYATREPRATLSAVNLSKIGDSTTGLVGALETLANTMTMSATQGDWNALAAARNAAYKYGKWSPTSLPFPSHDVVDLLTRLCDTPGVSASVVAAATGVISAHADAIIACRRGSQATANGLAIYSPAPGDEDRSADYNYDLNFLVDTQWAEVANGIGPQRATGAYVAADQWFPGQTALRVYGTDGDDRFTFEQVSGGGIQLTTSMPGWSKVYYPPAGKYIARVYVYAYGGNDTITFDENMTRPGVIYGGPDDDRITTQLGNDTLVGGPGDDVLDAGEGNDRIAGGDGADRLYGQEGNDRLFGGKGNDSIVGGSGNDLLFGGRDADTLWGDAGNDTLIGGLAADQLVDSGGANRLLGGKGDDRLWGGDGKDLLHGGAGDDVLYGKAGDDRLYGGVGNDYLDGQAGNDQLFGEAGNDRLFGGLGRNLLVGGWGADQLRASGAGDVLIGGLTSYDFNTAALAAIMAEWTGNSPLNTRTRHLNGTLAKGRNGQTFLRMNAPSKTVYNDNAVNDLYADSSQDWSLAFAQDQRHPRG